ncbi:MAG: hypothetical protein FWD90_01110 [Defluviitaleaceae bacterium]|nr:hypothetical protein [Defluviitaleaceae bacterium]
MAGKIFTLRNGDELTELTPTQFSNENHFQGLIEKHPEILAGDQINPDNPRKWLFISREMGVPAEQDGGTQWYLDHLFIDQDAIPTFVEVKRSTDTRIRREVVAQMLDYAANAVQYWPIETIRNKYEQNISDTNSLPAIGIVPGNEDIFWQSVSVNLRAGRIRMMFVADTIPSPLQRIIEFLNTQMVDSEVLGLEIKQFLSANGMTTLVPHLIGRTAAAVQTKRGESRKWDEQSFLEQAVQVSGNEIAAVCEKLLRLFESLGCYIWWGEGKDRGGFVPVYIGKQRHQLCSVYNWYKKSLVEIYFQYMKEPFTSTEYRMELKNNLERIPGVYIPDERIEKRPSFETGLLNDSNNFDLFADAMTSYIEDIKAHETT